MKYHHRVRSHRIVAVVLLLGFLAGTLFDRCLVACEHDTANTAPTASCHHDVVSNGVNIHGVALCDHDQQALLADPWADVRSGSRHTLTPAVAETSLTGAYCLQAVDLADPSAASPSALTQVLARRQLRL